MSIKTSMLTPDLNNENRSVNLSNNYSEDKWERVLIAIENRKLAVQQEALETAVRLIGEEIKSPEEQFQRNGYYFPINRLKSVLMKLLSPEGDCSNLITEFVEISNYPDIIFFTWKCLPSLTPKTQPYKAYISNLLELIHKLPLPKDTEVLQQKISSNPLLCELQAHNATFTWDQNVVKRALNKTWACIMHWELIPQLHKKLLIVLLEKVMPHLEKPVLLIDFFMDSLDIDGPIGLLALQGVFHLVTKHNLEYPNIFTKLYSMFEPEIFHTKYKARLFYLSDLFLSSTHLPEALVAAFAKRLARLTLVAPPEDILIILLFIGNLLFRHSGLKRLIDHPEGGHVIIEGTDASDPFLMEERDPLQSNALHSSLWEIKSLQWHILPSVAAAARFIREPIPSVEFDMASALERTGGHIFNREMKSKVQEIMLSFERPNSMALPKGERLLQYWHLTTTN